MNNDMRFHDKELKGFNDIYSYVVSNNNGIYKLIYEDKTINCTFETCYESDNDLDDNDVNYDEFEVIVFTDFDDKHRFEINYKNIPDKIYHNDILIFVKKTNIMN